MPFSRERAALTDAQLSMAEAIDKVYEVCLEIKGGMKFKHLITVPSLYAPLSKIVRLVSGVQGGTGLRSLLLGAAAAFDNDNDAYFARGEHREVLGDEEL